MISSIIITIWQVSISGVGSVDTLFLQIQAQQVALPKLALVGISVRRATPRSRRDLICAGTSGTTGRYVPVYHTHTTDEKCMLRSISLYGKAIYHVNSHLWVFTGNSQSIVSRKKQDPLPYSQEFAWEAESSSRVALDQKRDSIGLPLNPFVSGGDRLFFFWSCWASSEPPVGGESTQGQCRAGWLLESLPENVNVCSTSASIRWPSVVPPEL